MTGGTRVHPPNWSDLEFHCSPPHRQQSIHKDQNGKSAVPPSDATIAAADDDAAVDHDNDDDLSQHGGNKCRVGQADEQDLRHVRIHDPRGELHFDQSQV